MMRPAPGDNVVLIGFMGAGKTSVGRSLARRLRRRFVDLDRLAARSAGMSIPAIFSTWGERRFRRLERRLVKSASRGRGRVIAAGGGAPACPENRRWLRRAGLVVHLKAPVALLVRRLGRGRGRPLLAGAADRRALISRVRRLLASRASSYARTADLTFHVGRLGPDRLAARIERALRRRREHAVR